MSAATIGHVEPFDEKDDDGEWYIERFELFVQCNNIIEAKKVPTLLTIIGKDTYEILKDLCTPTKPDVNLTIKLKNVYKIILNQNHVLYPNV